MIRTAHKFLMLLAVFALFALTANGQSRLEGEYKLDVSRSENVADIVESAARDNNTSQDNRADLESKLEAPESITIDVRGSRVTLSTSRSPNPVTFTADGRTRTSTRADGSTIRVRATLRGDRLTISSLGGETDYTLTFVSEDRGRSMRVTRRITTPYLRQTVFADSYYDKTDRFGNTNTSDSTGGYSSSDPQDDQNRDNSPKVRTVGNGNFIVPQGTVLTGTLDNKISTRESQNNDRFSMTIQSPKEYDGAIVEGYLTNVKRSGRVSGRSSFTMNFETIRMTDGRTYEFAGVLQTATDATGKIIKTGEEGETKGKSRTKESIKRGGIGAGIGAILGGIIGGAKGAIIGATIGGSAGTGSVIAQGRGDVELKEGSTVTVESTSPNR